MRVFRLLHRLQAGRVAPIPPEHQPLGDQPLSDDLLTVLSNPTRLTTTNSTAHKPPNNTSSAVSVSIGGRVPVARNTIQSIDNNPSNNRGAVTRSSSTPACRRYSGSEGSRMGPVRALQPSD